MFEPRAKLEFVRRYCPPPRFSGCVDIDASEEGRTGGPGKSEVSKRRQHEMNTDAVAVRHELSRLNVHFNYREWLGREEFAGLPSGWRGPDIIACGHETNLCIVAEVEAKSSDQPEQKLYKAVGQVVRTLSEFTDRWRRAFVIVVYGQAMADHLARMTALQRLNITAISLGRSKNEDRLLFGSLDL